MDIYIGYQVDKATRGFLGCVVHTNRVIRISSMGRAHSMTRRWRVEKVQPYNIEAMDQKWILDD